MTACARGEMTSINEEGVEVAEDLFVDEDDLDDEDYLDESEEEEDEDT